MVVKNWRPIMLMKLDQFWQMGINTGWYKVTCALSLEEMEHMWVFTKESFTYVNYKNRHNTFRNILLLRRKGDVPTVPSSMNATGGGLTNAEL